MADVYMFKCMCGFCRVGYRLQKPYRGTLLRTAVRSTVYRNSIKLTVIVNLSAAMGIHSIDWPYLMVYEPKTPQSSVMMLFFHF